MDNIQNSCNYSTFWSKVNMSKKEKDRKWDWSNKHWQLSLGMNQDQLLFSCWKNGTKDFQFKAIA